MCRGFVLLLFMRKCVCDFLFVRRACGVPFIARVCRCTRGACVCDADLSPIHDAAAGFSYQPVKESRAGWCVVRFLPRD